MILILLVLLLTALYLYLRYVFSYWQRKGFPYVEPSIPWGNLSLVALRKTSFGINISELYNKSREPFVGIYFFFRPGILIRDAELTKKILATDFNSFYDRGVYCNGKQDPLSETLFALPGKRWKNLRSKLSPTFTSGKLKGMFSTILEVGENLEKYLVPLANRSEVVDMKDILSRYALDVIGSVAFGMDVNTLENPNSDFRNMDKRVNNGDLHNVFRQTLQFLYPRLMEFFNLKIMDQDVREYMISIVQKTIEHREKNNSTRKDFIQCLIQLRNDGQISVDDGLWDSENVTNSTKSMTIEQCAAQVFLFYLAGFDTSASTVAYCLFELTRNPECLAKLREEIAETFQRNNGQLTYEAFKDMPYLDLCVMETVRKYPALPILNRECTIDYQIPNSHLTIQKGTPIIISLFGMMRDPEHFPEPMKFIPERFLETNRNYNPNAYIPFGDGPRACIGFRQGKIISKIAITLLLQKYEFEAVDNNEIEFENHSVVLVPKNGINLKVTNRSQ